MDRGSTERLPRETPAPEDYYELPNSQPPAACVGCQAWSKAQGSGSCPVGVRRFKSCPTHPSRSVEPSRAPANRFRRGLGHSSLGSPRPSTRWRFGPHDSGRASAAPPDPKLALNPCTKIDIPSEPIRLEALPNRRIQRTFVSSHLLNLIKGITRADDIRPPRRLRSGYTFERFVL